MTGVNRFDLRQSIYRTYLNMIARKSDFNTQGYNALGNIMAAVNTQVTPAFALTANDPVSLVVNVGANKVANAETDIRHANPPINKQWPNFTGGTITLPSTSGGSITVSPTIQPAPTLTLSPGQTVLGLVEVDSLGNLSVTLGTAGSSESTATFPGLNSKALQIGIIVISNTGGTIDSMTGAKLIQFVGGGGSGLGTGGSGTGDDLDALQFVASFTDNLSELPTDTAVAVDYSTGKTQSVNYSSQNNLIRISYDASKTVTGTGTAMTLSASPAYTVAVGDILVVGTEARRITVVSSQTVYTIESAFSSNPSAAACTVSQAIYTKDLYNSAIDGVSAYSILGSSISEILLKYDDSTTLGQTIPSFNTAPVIGYVASVDGSTYSSVTVRSTNVTDVDQPLDLPTSGTNLYIRFFANAASGSGAVNLLKYKVFFGRQQTGATGNTIQQAIAVLNGSGTAINCSVLTPVSGKSRIQMSWSYPLNAASGLANGALTVYINGQKVPRYIAGSTIGSYYKEISPNVIELDQDYSSLSYEIEIIYNTSVIDASSTNSTDLAALQEISKFGFQGFVNNTSNFLVATSNPGTPAAGTFYSTIKNRAPIPDLSQSLATVMGVNRIPVQAIYQSQSEFGPNGEPVWLAQNDTLGRIRFVGQWQNYQGTSGLELGPSVVGDYVEVTFYGTGLNLLGLCAGGAGDLRLSTDGGAEGSNIYINGSGVLGLRNSSTNQIMPAVSGLSLGIHTVKMRVNASPGAFGFYGFEVLNESANVKVNPGTGYASGKALINPSQASFAYNSMVTGTAGGRVLVYQKADGTIGSAFTATGSPAYLTSTNHVSEEISRTYAFREFGAGRSDDFSYFTSPQAAAFTLDDGTTTLTSTNSFVAAQGLAVGNSNGATTSFTFVGTGLDIVRMDNGTGGADVFTVSIDGAAPITVSLTGVQQVRTQTIASGLPYGTHTARFARASSPSTYDMFIQQFIVYQPKTPSLPSGAVALSAYNIMANFVANSTYGDATIATGTLRKFPTREFVYVGSQSAGLNNSGWYVTTTTQNDYHQITFFGTGFDLRFEEDTSAASWTLSVDGNVNMSAYSSGIYGNGSTYNKVSGVINPTVGSAQIFAGVWVSGLPLGLHTVRLTNNSTSGANMAIRAIDIITPIHSHKSNLPADLQNTLTVGSQSIGDERVFSPVANQSNTKAWAQAVGVTNNPSTTSTALIPMPDMSCAVKTGAGSLRISYNATIYGNAGIAVYTQLYVDGSAVGTVKSGQIPVNTYDVMTSDVVIVPVAAGFHKVDVYWYVSSGTATLDGIKRSLVVEER